MRLNGQKGEFPSRLPANASDWVKIGSTATHHDAEDLPAGPGKQVHINGYDEHSDWSVDRASIHREGPYMKAWTETHTTGCDQAPLCFKKTQQLLEIDCDEQKHKSIETIVFSDENKMLSHLVAGAQPCGFFGASPQSDCSPIGWGEANWESTVPDSIMEDIVHFICKGGSKKH
jgi:hypothetical protein